MRIYTLLWTVLAVALVCAGIRLGCAVRDHFTEAAREARELEEASFRPIKPDPKSQGLPQVIDGRNVRMRGQ
jgi:hypothetical protein